jgi:glycosyltransferase involved in cell wall biosynthesis
MRILYSHRTKSADGQYVHIRSLTEALKRRGHQIIMAGPDDSGDSARRPLDAREAVSARAALPKLVYEAAELLYSARGYARLAAAASARPDVLYERYNLYYHAGVRLARARKIPLLLEVNAPLFHERSTHGGLALKPLARASERSIWRAADRVLPVTRALARMIEAEGVAPERLVVIPNGVDREFLDPVDPAPVRERYGLQDKLVLGFTGFVRDWHGLDRVVRYLARRRDNLHLLVVGDGDARCALEREAASLGVARRMTFTGVVQRDSVPAHVAAFDVALQPAVVPYASPLKLIEYMALGRAIIAPARDNIREILTDGADALLVAPEDEGALHAGLDALIEDQQLRSRLGAAARASCLRRRLTWDANAEKVEIMANELLSRGR